MTTKQRAYLKSLAMTMDPIFQIGKSSMTPGLTQAIAEALDARELIKISVLQNCADDPRELAELVAARTRSRDSFTAASGRPTTSNPGRPEERSVSTSTGKASMP